MANDRDITGWIERDKDAIIRSFDTAGSIDTWKDQVYVYDTVNTQKVRWAGSASGDGYVAINTVTKTLKSASINITATGTIISAVGGKRLKIYAVRLNVSAAGTVNWRDGGSTNLEGGQAYAANGGYTQSVDPPNFLFQTTAGNSLDLVLSAGSPTIAGMVSYWDDDGS